MYKFVQIHQLSDYFLTIYASNLIGITQKDMLMEDCILFSIGILM